MLNPPTLIASRRKKVATNGFKWMEHQLGLDINKIDLKNLCELPKPILQQVEAIMENYQGDGVKKLLETELMLQDG